MIFFGLIHGDFLNLVQVNMTELGFLNPLNDQLKSPQFSIKTSTDVLPDNNTWRDYPEDEDKNGFFDHLIVELGWINFTEFDGVYGILKDKDENLIGTSQFNRYDSGKIVKLSFLGQPINAGGTDGPYVIEVGLFTYSGWWWWIGYEINFTHQYITTTSYNHGDFEPPSATIVGFSDYLVDTNEDQFYDEIVFNLGVEVKDPGHYEIELFLEDSTPFPGSNNDFTAHWNGFLTPNGNEVEISYSLHNYISWGLSGPYNVSYVQLQFYGQDHQFLTTPYSTDSYPVSEFEPPQVKLTGRFFDWGVDLDTDGIYEELALSVEVNVTRNRGLYYSNLNFDPLDTDQNHWDQGAETEEHLKIGVQNVTFFADATSFYSLKNNTSFIITYFQIRDQEEYSQSWRGSLYTTQEYSYKEFNPPPAFLTGNNWDYLVDANTDGIYEEFKIEVEVNITKAGSYEMDIHIIPFGLNNSDWNLWGDYSRYLPKGVLIIPFSFDTTEEDFFHLRENTSFLLKEITLRDVDGNLMDFADKSHITQKYSYEMFPPPRAFFTGKYSDHGINSDDDNQFEELTFTVEINVTQTTRYRVRLALRSVDLDQNPWEEWVETPLSPYSDTGKYNITLSFDAASLYSIRKDTSFLIRQIEILDSDWHTLDRVNSPYITRLYRYTEFRPPIVFFTGRYWDVGADIDRDGMFDFLDVLVEVNVTQDGPFSFDFNIRTYVPVWDSYFGESIDRDLNEGVQNISLEIYLTLPYSLRVDTAYIFEEISIYDSEGDHIDQVRQPHLTRVYQYEEFDPPSAILTGKSWDHGVDTDLDGTFDALSVIFEVDVSQPDIYSYDFHWYESEWELHRDGSINEYWEEGLNNLSILVYSAPLYLLDKNSHHIVENIRIYDHGGHLLDRMLYDYTTQSYSYLEFDRPGAFLRDEFWDDGINLDSDSKYEEILVSVGVDVFQQGVYTVRLELSVDNPEYKEFTFSVQDLLEEGFNDIYVYVPSAAFFSYSPFSGFDSPFHLQVKLVQLFKGDDDLIHQIYNPYWTREYHHSDFDLFNNPATTATTAVGNPDWRLPFGLFLLVSILLVLFLSHKWKKPSSP